MPHRLPAARLSLVAALTLAIAGCVGMPLAELQESTHVARTQSTQSAEIVFRCVRNKAADEPTFHQVHLIGQAPISNIEAMYYPEQKLGEMFMRLNVHGYLWRLEISGVATGSSLTRYASNDWHPHITNIDKIIAGCTKTK